jgi:hypothetical protein
MLVEVHQVLSPLTLFCYPIIVLVEVHHGPVVAFCRRYFVVSSVPAHGRISHLRRQNIQPNLTLLDKTYLPYNRILSESGLLPTRRARSNGVVLTNLIFF